MYYTCNVSSEVSEAFSEQNTIKNKTLFFLALICPYTNTVSTCIKDSSSFSSRKIFYAQTRHISVKEIYYSRCHSWTVINKCVPTFSFKEKNSNLASLWGAGIRERWGRTLEDNCDFWYRSQLQLWPPSKVFACRAKLVILQGGLAFYRFSQDIDTSIKEKMRPEFLMHNYKLGWRLSPQ